RAIDAELRARGLEPHFVDGLRVTDAAALETVVSVLAGRTNTAFVAALHASGVRAIGLTGADAGIGLSQKAGAFTTAAGSVVDLGLVGQPVDAPVTLLQDLTSLGYVPVIASIGVAADGSLLNVNADTLAGHLAGMLRADRLLIAGGTAGVLDGDGRTIEALNPEQLDGMIASGVAHSGMVAKLTACRGALTCGVRDVAIVSGRGAIDFDRAAGTRVLGAAYVEG
ncbi:MAG TPA: acetylglutamate kinase, partial [Vicinamibacterales bacterium]